MVHFVDIINPSGKLFVDSSYIQAYYYYNCSTEPQPPLM